jgi:hypothetical protein
MSDKSTLSRAFNNMFFEFLNDILAIFPDNTDIRTTKTALEMFKQANPSAVIKAWIQYVYVPYRSVIEQGDLTFFFEKDYSQDLNNLSNANDIMKAIDKIREPIKAMSESNKNTALKYLQNLTKLAAIYNSLP